METMIASRRELLLAPMLAALSSAFVAGEGVAAPNPAMTIVKLPSELVWTPLLGSPQHCVESVALWGKPSDAGLYYTLIKWYPGYMSAPHWYEEDRYCVVLSGTWWVTSGDKFDAESTIPAPPGTFIRRVARTPHYDGVKKNGAEPAVIAICGMGPITFHNAEPGTQPWRQV
jgi:hypothetical protein